MVYRITAIIVLSMCLALLPVTSRATDSKNQGLFVTPLRQEVTLVPNGSLASNLTVGDLTDKTMKVDLEVKQFSVTDYSYDYRFRPPEYDWIKLTDRSVTLQPGEKKQVDYTVAVPANAATGGYYFALFASTLMSDHGVKSTVQAVSLLYLKIDGNGVVRSTTIQDENIPFIVTGSDIPYKFDVKNKGNVHFSGNFFAQLEGVTGKVAAVESDHIILPGTIRTISGLVPAPLLPGVYKLTYGYRAEVGPDAMTKTSYIVFIPPWSVVALLLSLYLAQWLWRKKRRRGDDQL